MTIKSLNVFKFCSPFWPARRNFFLWDTVTRGHCRLIGHSRVQSLSLSAHSHKSGKCVGSSVLLITEVKEKSLAPLPTISITYLNSVRCKKTKIPNWDGAGNYMPACRWGMWPRLQSPGHHSFSTGHFLSLGARRLGICVYLPCRCSLNPRLSVVSDAPHSGTRGQTDRQRVVSDVIKTKTEARQPETKQNFDALFWWHWQAADVTRHWQGVGMDLSLGGTPASLTVSVKERQKLLLLSGGWMSPERLETWCRHQAGDKQLFLSVSLSKSQKKKQKNTDTPQL